MWSQGNIAPNVINTFNTSLQYSLFVTITGRIYVSRSLSDYRVDEWNLNATPSNPAMYISVVCVGLFVDSNNTMYCSLPVLNEVVSRWLLSGTNTTTVVASSWSNGSGSDSLYYPQGIFVDLNFTLYVADCLNNRIERFWFGDSNGTSVAGVGASSTISLFGPTGVVLDADGYLFVLDAGQNRIVASGPYGFRCIVGCSTRSGTAMDQLNDPQAFALDGDGNIYVADTKNNRTQKFTLDITSCGTYPALFSPSRFWSPDQWTTFWTFFCFFDAGNAISNDEMTSEEPMHTTETTTLSPSIGMSNVHIIQLKSDLCVLFQQMHRLASLCLVPARMHHWSAQTAMSRRVHVVYCSPVRIRVLVPTMGQFLAGTDACVRWDSTVSGVNLTIVSVNRTLVWMAVGASCDPKDEADSFLGLCNASTNTSVVCSCQSGWQGSHCETQINYCQAGLCLNGGVCRSMLLTYRCECLGDSYSGRHCELIASHTRTYQMISRSFAFVAIVAMGTVALFIIIMDVLKYGFGIDPIVRVMPAKKEKKKRCLDIVRYVYVDGSPAIVVESPETKRTWQAMHILLFWLIISHKTWCVIELDSVVCEHGCVCFCLCSESILVLFWWVVCVIFVNCSAKYPFEVDCLSLLLLFQR